MRISKDVVTFSIIGAGARSTNYVKALEQRYPGKFKIVAIAEPHDAKREMFVQKYSIPRENVFKDYREFNKQDRLSDVVIIGTLDDMHFEPAVSALEKGYDLILEKPISMNLKETIAVGDVASKYPNQMVAVCHVLRHSPFFAKLKEIVDSKELGNIVDIQHTENIGYYHFAHSYVRGNWRNTDVAAPISVAKTCHDFDLLLYLLGEDIHCEYISSMGELTFFNHNHYDETRMAKNCRNCSLEKTCPYSSTTIYTEEMITAVVFDKRTTELFLANIDALGYGRCVFACDNNVPDHQVTIMKFTNGIHASFNMTAFSPNISREIKICCEYGEIMGDEHTSEIKITKFGEAPKTIVVPKGSSGHNGADAEFITNFMESYLNGKKFSSAIKDSIESHVVAFAAEDSRKRNGEHIHIPTYWDESR